MNSFHHIPVLIKQVIQILSPQKGDRYLDLTAGYGGHAGEIVSSGIKPGDMTLVDRDKFAVDHLLANRQLNGSRIIKSDYLKAVGMLADENQRFDMVLLDLGVSSPQLDNIDRGFSFQTDASLDMRMDQQQSLSAGDIVNTYSEQQLIQILQIYGNEPKAKKIANLIVANRPVDSTVKLANIVSQAYSGRWMKKHPATRTFQSIRIAVNDEITQLEQVLSLVSKISKSNTRVAIISFHSLEDRIVKNWIRENSYGYESIINKIDSTPFYGKIDDVNNPRARSAVLRGFVFK
ncbi:MAG: 16S rRNA (cytosine(1402)-N(4))-methyltransferase RsmH [Candidatus Saccharimonadales bacterium]